MVSTLTRPGPPVTGTHKDVPLRLKAARQRRPGFLAASLAVVALSLALFVSAYVKAGRQISVLAVAKVVPQGAVVQAGDLEAVRIAGGSKLDLVPTADAGEIVGRHAAVALVPGVLVTLGELTSRATLPLGQSLVGVAAKASQLPAEGVAPGQSVEVVLTGTPGSPALTADAVSSQGGGGAVTGIPSSLAGTILAPDVLVTSVAPPVPNSDTTDVSLLVPADVAPVVASASAAGQVALVVVAPVR